MNSSSKLILHKCVVACPVGNTSLSAHMHSPDIVGCCYNHTLGRIYKSISSVYSKLPGLIISVITHIVKSSLIVNLTLYSCMKKKNTSILITSEQHHQFPLITDRGTLKLPSFNVTSSSGPLGIGQIRLCHPYLRALEILL